MGQAGDKVCNGRRSQVLLSGVTGVRLTFVPGGMMVHEGKDQLSPNPAAHQGVGLLPLLGESFWGFWRLWHGTRALCLAHLLSHPGSMPCWEFPASFVCSIPC